MDTDTEDELEELKDSVRDDLEQLNEQLMGVVHIEEVLEQADEHGSVSLNVKERSTGQGATILSISAWLPSLTVRGSMSDKNLAESLIQLSSNHARVSYDSEASVYSIKLDTEL